MDILDRLLAHDTWTTRQLLLACRGLSDDLLDMERAGLREHIEGDLLSWESRSFGWR